MIALPETALRVDLGTISQGWVQCHAAAVCASVKRNGWREKYAKGRTMTDAARLDQHVHAFTGELGVALGVGLPWNPVILEPGYRLADKPADVGSWIEVRTSRYRDRGLRAQADDAARDHRLVFVLAWVEGWTVWIVGWLPWAELIRPAYAIEDGPFRGWQAPAADLRPIHTLPLDLVR